MKEKKVKEIWMNVWRQFREIYQDWKISRASETLARMCDKSFPEDRKFCQDLIQWTEARVRRSYNELSPKMKEKMAAKFAEAMKR